MDAAVEAAVFKNPARPGLAPVLTLACSGAGGLFFFWVDAAAETAVPASAEAEAAAAQSTFVSFVVVTGWLSRNNGSAHPACIDIAAVAVAGAARGKGEAEAEVGYGCLVAPASNKSPSGGSNLCRSFAALSTFVLHVDCSAAKVPTVLTPRRQAGGMLLAIGAPFSPLLLVLLALPLASMRRLFVSGSSPSACVASAYFALTTLSSRASWVVATSVWEDGLEELGVGGADAVLHEEDGEEGEEEGDAEALFAGCRFHSTHVLLVPPLLYPAPAPAPALALAAAAAAASTPATVAAAAPAPAFRAPSECVTLLLITGESLEVAVKVVAGKGLVVWQCSGLIASHISH